MLAAGLADAEKWPELNGSPSNYASDNEDEAATSVRKRTGFPGARGLTHTQTILGPSRVGAMGISASAAVVPNLGTSLGLASSLGMSSSHGPQILLKIRVDMEIVAMHYLTTISVYVGPALFLFASSS